MKTFLVRGVPNSVQMDGWWMNEPPAPRDRRTYDTSQPFFPRLIALLTLIVAGDALLWGAQPGISLALFGMAILVVLWLANGRRGTGALGFATLAFLPLIEHAQALSFSFFFVALLLSVVWISLGSWPGMARWFGGLWRFIHVAPDASLHEARNIARAALSTSPETTLKSVLQSWLVPLGLGLIFASLLISANPMLSAWIDGALSIKWLSDTLIYRMLFWVGLAILTLPMLMSVSMPERLKHTPNAFPALRVPDMLNASSIYRSLILFNLMFAVQTTLDITYLWGGARLPEGMSYAAYAHRGAYPLLVTALLAGLFALVARPFTRDIPVLRSALLAWVAQNIFLVLSSLLRLDLYVTNYGLTHLRIAAFIWMVVVALGLMLVIYQTLNNKPAAWLLARTALLGVAALYAACFLSFSATIARYNLNQDYVRDSLYICNLGRHALPAIVKYQAKHGVRLCYSTKQQPHQISDWREWGFRDWRLQRSLETIAETQVKESL